MDDSLKSILEELEKSSRDSIVKTFVNQPNKIGVSSASGTLGNSSYGSFQDTGFSNFTVNLKRPALGVKGMQLLKLNVPQCHTSFGDYELVFYYYRLKTQLTTDGKTKFVELPNINNLYCVRLLPSYYKRELINNSAQYGFNRVFTSYDDFAGELQKITQNDLAFNNDPQHKFPFLPNDISLTYDTASNKFQMTGNNVSTPFTAPTWNQQSLYKANFIVSYLGSLYICLSDNKNYIPTINPTRWAPYNTDDTDCHTYLIPSPDDENIATLSSSQYIPFWNAFRIYDVGDVVVSAEKVWGSQTTNQGVQPPQIYSASIAYKTGDIVYYNGYTYSAQQNNINVLPPNSSSWMLTKAQDWKLTTSQETPYTLGIAGLSKKWDFEILQSIPPQPSNVSKRNLALRMGFTWTDTDKLTTSIVSPDNYTEGSTLTLILNRLRPIPMYSLGAPSQMLSAYPAFSTGTISADGFANLVYSSVLYVYTDVVSASTMDTQRTNNLLAIAPVSCGSLGVSFTGDSVENILNRVNSDIYALYFELHDEAGQPYYISNNGTVTMEIKLTYE